MEAAEAGVHIGAFRVHSIAGGDLDLDVVRVRVVVVVRGLSLGLGLRLGNRRRA